MASSAASSTLLYATRNAGLCLTYINATAAGCRLTMTDGVRRARFARVLKGGAWNSDPAALRAASRIRAAPDARASYYGFRVARMLERE